MSTKAFARSGIALALLVVAACSETLAPKLERIQSQIANAFGCDVTWNGMAGDGQWQNPGNWTTLAVPNGTQEVCITRDFATTVVVRQDAFAKNITIGTPGNATKQTLALEGWFGFGARANLTVSGGIDNYGELVLRGTGHFPAAPNLVAGTIENHAGARMLASDVGFSGGITYLVNATVVNDGLLELRYHTELRGHWTNRGTTQMVAGFGYNLPNGSWVQAGGSLAAEGTFIITDGLFRLENGTILGAIGPIMERGTFTIGDGAVATGNITLRNAVAMSGDVPAGLTVIAAGHSYSTTGINFQTFVTAANGFANRGTIRLISTGHAFGQPSHLIVTNGTIDNHGRIESHVGNSDAGRVINASIMNRAGAVVELLSNTDFNKPGATYENHGTITTAASKFITLTGAPSFMQNGALTLGANAQWKQEGGSFRLAGPIVGRPWLAGIALDIPAGSPGTGTLLLTHTNTITGDVPAGVKLHIENFRFGTTGSAFDGILNASASYTNFGTIVLGNPGFQPNPARVVMLNGSTLTNKGRFETVPDPSGNHRFVVGNFTNEGTLQLDNWTQFLGGTVRSLAPATVTMGPNGQGLFDLQPGATLHASGSWGVQLVNRGHLFIGAPNTAASLHLREYGGANGSHVTMDIGGSPAAPGTDFDRLTMTGPMTFGAATLNVRALNGACVDGGNSYNVIAYSHPSGNFANFTGLDLGAGRMVVPEQLPAGYRLSVTGTVCPPPDATPPVITPTVSGTLGLASWYTSDVTVAWSVTDAESPVTSKVGCDEVSLTSDNAGVTYTCEATSAGGTATQSVTIKRDATPPVITTGQSPMPNAHGWNNTDVTAFFSATDAMSGLEGAADRQNTFTGEGIAMNFGGRYFDKAGNMAEALVYASIDRTPPVVSATRAPAANANGWNNTDVTATYSATDALSGLDGAASATELFASEGENQAGSKVFTDKAGNTATANIDGISIDKIAPTVTVTRSPLPDATGWNNTDVTATWTATDALSGIDGASSATHLFNTDGAGQSATRSFSDRAGNGASATIDNINIDKTPAPPPPPPPTTITPVCSVTPDVIWPPNNKMVAVRATIGGTGVTALKLRSVTNNETGTADVAGWTLGTADVDGSVLAKRNGGGSGRTYTLTYDVFGANGATGSCAVTVRVPHDQRR